MSRKVQEVQRQKACEVDDFVDPSAAFEVEGAVGLAELALVKKTAVVAGRDFELQQLLV